VQGEALDTLQEPGPLGRALGRATLHLVARVAEKGHAGEDFRQKLASYSSGGEVRMISCVESAAAVESRHAELFEEMVHAVRLLVNGLAHRTRQLFAVVLKAATRIEALE